MTNCSADEETPHWEHKTWHTARSWHQPFIPKISLILFLSACQRWMRFVKLWKTTIFLSNNKSQQDGCCFEISLHKTHWLMSDTSIFLNIFNKLNSLPSDFFLNVKMGLKIILNYFCLKWLLATKSKSHKAASVKMQTCHRLHALFRKWYSALWPNLDLRQRGTAWIVKD